MRKVMGTAVDNQKTYIPINKLTRTSVNLKCMPCKMLLSSILYKQDTLIVSWYEVISTEVSLKSRVP